MLLEFSVTNYRSFKEKTTFSMLADEAKEEHSENIIHVSNKLKVLKSAVIYGANASGKSNFMKAFEALSFLVLSSTQKKPNELFEEYEPFLFDTDSQQQPTVFEIDFLADGTHYKYKVTLTEKQIEKESLWSYPHNRQTILFERNSDTKNMHFGESLKGQKKIIASLTANNQLFLSKALENNVKQLIPLYDFFHKDFYSISINDKDSTSDSTNMIARELKSNYKSNFSKNFLSLIKSFDTGIIDFKITKKGTIWHSKNFPAYKIETEHKLIEKETNKAEKIYISLEEESDGTQKLFVIGGFILHVIMNGQVIVIDEFGQNLHPHISQFILKMFNDPEINTNNAQLIFATHDTNLLDKSTNLRRDQIWIVEKDEYGASELFSLADIEGIRKDIPFEKWYLSGRFGGVPSVKELNFKLNYQASQS